MELSRRARHTLALGLATASLFGGAEGAAAETGILTPPDLSATQHRYLGGQAIDGCDLGQARLELSLRVLDGASFKARIFTDRQGQPLPSLAFNAKTAIANAIPLDCRGRRVAYAGIVDPLRAMHDTAYDPVRIIKPGDKDFECYTIETGTGHCAGRSNPTQVVSMRLGQEALSLFGNDYAGAFKDQFDHWEGVANDRFSKIYEHEGPLRHLNDPIAHPPKPIINRSSPQQLS